MKLQDDYYIHSSESKKDSKDQGQIHFKFKVCREVIQFHSNLKSTFYQTNRAEPNQMPHFAAFDLRSALLMSHKMD